jgi:hypothetical protein
MTNPTQTPSWLIPTIATAAGIIALSLFTCLLLHLNAIEEAGRKRVSESMGKRLTVAGKTWTATRIGTWGGIECVADDGTTMIVSLATVENLGK